MHHRLTNRLMIGLLLLAMLGSLLVILTRFSFDANLNVFFPDSKTPVERLLVEQLDRGPTANLVFVTVHGSDPARLVQINQSMATDLKLQGVVSEVFNGRWKLPEEDLKLIFNYRYLLSKQPIEEIFSQENLRKSLLTRLEDLYSPVQVLSKIDLAQDPTNERKKIIADWLSRQKKSTPRLLNGIWVADDLSESYLVLALESSGTELSSQADSIAAIKNAFTKASGEQIGVTMTLAGVAAYAVETREVISRDAQWIGILSILMVGAFLLSVFRSLRWLLFLLLPLICGILVATAAVLLLFESIHGVTLAFGMTLIGITVDYPIHILSHRNKAEQSLQSAVIRIWPTLRMGVITTAIAYTSLCFSEFIGLRQLGVFSLFGMLTAAITSRWLLPEMAPPRLDGKGSIAENARLLRLGRRMPRLQKPSLLVVAVALIVLLVTDLDMGNFDVERLSPVSAKTREAGNRARDSLGMWSGGRLLVLQSPSPEQVLVKSEELERMLSQFTKQGVIGGYEMASLYLPSARRQLSRQQDLPPSSMLQNLLVSAQQGLPFSADAFTEFVHDVDASKSIPPLTMDLLADTTFASYLNSLLFRQGNVWTAVVLLYEVANPGQLTQHLKASYPTDEVVYLDLKEASSQLIDRAVDAAIWLLTIASVLVYLLLLLHFRNLFRPLRVLFPIIASLLVTNSIFILCGIEQNLFHTISMLIVIGLGLDYSLFFDRSQDRHEEWGVTFQALLVCCVTTVLAFGLLIFSHTPPLQAIGVTVSTGALASFLFSSILASRSQ